VCVCVFFLFFSLKSLKFFQVFILIAFSFNATNNIAKKYIYVFLKKFVNRKGEFRLNNYIL
jgi:hypothetical protein